MADDNPYTQFAPPPPPLAGDNPYAQFATPQQDKAGVKPYVIGSDAAAEQRPMEATEKLDALGRGILSAPANVVGNVDRLTGKALKEFGIDTGSQQRYQNFRQAEATTPDNGYRETGKIIGQVADTIPLAMTGAAPILVGAASGLMNTEADTGLGAVKDTALGAIGGKAGDIAGNAVGRAAGSLINKYAPNAGLLSSPASPKIAQKAVDYVTRLMDSSDVTPADLTAIGSSTTKPLTSAEVIGKSGTTGLGAFARREGTTGDALEGLLRQRAINAPSRMLDDYATASGIDPRLAQGDIDGYVDAGRKTVKPMFDQALGTGANMESPAVWNSKLSMISQRPVVQKAMSAVVEDLKNADIDPTAMGFTAQDPATGKFVQMPRPTAQAWDLVKKRVGSLAERDGFGRVIPDSQSPGNFNINKAGRDLTGALRSSIPGYGDALDASGDYLSMRQAFQDGQDFILNPKVTAQQVIKHVSGLTTPEQEAFKGGIANKLFDQAQNGRLSASAFYRRGNGTMAPIPAISQKLQTALGPQNAQTFLGALDNEGRMAAAAGRMVPGSNSPTAEFNEAIRQQDSGYGLPDEVVNVGKDLLTHGSAKGAALSAVGRTAGKAVAAYQTRGMPVEVRNEAGRLLMMHPSDLGTYLNGIASAPQPGSAQIARTVGNAIKNSGVPMLAGTAAASLVSPNQ